MRPAEMIEGPEAYQRFTAAMRAVLTVKRETVQRQIEEHRKAAAENPNRRGPKRKAAKPAASPAPAF